MKRILLFLASMTALSVYAIDPSGARLVTESSGSSTVEMIAMVLGGIVLAVIGIPMMIWSLKSENKDDKNFGCFMLVGIILLIIVLVSTCS